MRILVGFFGLLAQILTPIFTQHPTGGGGGTFAKVAEGVAGSSNSGVSVSITLNTTGATAILIAVSNYLPNTAFNVLSDAVGACSSPCNTWTQIGTQNGGSGSITTVTYYGCLSGCTVGSGHTFTYTTTSGSSYPTIGVLAVSGGAATKDQTNSAGTAGTLTSIQTGSVTPSVNNELLFTAFSVDQFFGGTPSIDSSFTFTGTSGIDYIEQTGGQCFPLAIAYQIQTTATARNPTWTWTSSATGAAAIIGTFE
jgi:hypothetical protein